MSDTIAFTKAQIEEITGYRQSSRQIEALAQMGVAYLVRPDGSPFVHKGAISVTSNQTQPSTAVLDLS